MSDPALLDLLEERGVKNLVMWAVKVSLGLDRVDQRCQCSPERMGRYPHAPHGPKCDIWRAATALGVAPMLVERDHQTAIYMVMEPDRIIQRIESGQNFGYQKLERMDFDMGEFGKREAQRVAIEQNQINGRRRARAEEQQRQDTISNAIGNKRLGLCSCIAQAPNITGHEEGCVHGPKAPADQQGR